MDAGELQRMVLLVLELMTTAFAFVLWTMFNNVRKVTENLITELAEYKLHVAENYVTSTALNESLKTLTASLTDSIKAIFNKLDRIEDKLDTKADKGPYDGFPGPRRYNDPHA